MQELAETAHAPAETDQLPQLYQLARKNLPRLQPGAVDKDGGQVQLAVRKARSRFFEMPPCEVFDGESALDSASETDSEISEAGVAEPKVPGPETSEPEVERLEEARSKPPGPHTVEALAGPVTGFRALQLNRDFLQTGSLEKVTPASFSENASKEESPPRGKLESVPARKKTPAARVGSGPAAGTHPVGEPAGAGWLPSLPAEVFNPADPVNLRGLLDATDVPLSEEEAHRAETALRAELSGLGPLEPLLATPQLTDIFVNGTEVWCEAAGALHRSDISLADDEETRALAVRLITAAGGRLDDSHPVADAQTASGLRVHAVLPPLSRSGTLLSIRVKSKQVTTLGDLQELGMLTDESAQLLRYLITSRANFLISGGTGTGKTTLLSALLATCSAAERLVLIEDTAELTPRHPHTVSLQARAANTEGRGAISLADLIRAALRMRPTRLVVGECRGAEMVDMLTAMNTGHSGTGGTVHANSSQAVPARLYAMGALAGLSERAVALQAATALDFIVHIDRVDGVRRVREIARLEAQTAGLTVTPLCRLEKGRRSPYLRWLPEGQSLREEMDAWARGTS